MQARGRAEARSCGSPLRRSMSGAWKVGEQEAVVEVQRSA